MGRRNSVATVNVDNDKGRIRLRWRYNGKRCSLNLPLNYKKAHLPVANRIAVYIENDLLNSRFDASLQKYKPLLSNNAKNSGTRNPTGENEFQEGRKEIDIPLQSKKEDQKA